MALHIDRMVVGREDRAAHFSTSTGCVLVVADGAGGTGDGAHAAKAVLEAVAANRELHGLGRRASAAVGGPLALLAATPGRRRRGT